MQKESEQLITQNFSVKKVKEINIKEKHKYFVCVHYQNN